MDYLEEPLPEWATRKATGELEVGLQLCTKDGRRMGNGVIIDAYTVTRYTPLEETYEIWKIMTDMGNVVNMMKEEVDEAFYLGDYVMDVIEAVIQRAREEISNA